MNRYVLKLDRFRRWIICQPGNTGFAWSGLRWVPIGGDIQICNFASENSAHSYAKGAGLEPGFATIDYDAPPENCA